MKEARMVKTSFADVFRHAEKKFGISWNACNDIFFHTIFDYKSYNEFDFSEVEGYSNPKGESVWSGEDLTDKNVKEFSNDYDKAYYLLCDFMKSKNMDYIFVDSK